ncbi:MAG TPA: FHA domain-containing protein [Tepidisphaeraceae bacterium]|nr:FHA domain-containing protein [Tepidisphaeraceae bacterium]
MPHLIVTNLNGDVIGRRPLLPGHVLTIGRSPENDLAVRDINLSRRHCRVEPDDDGWRLIDDGSKNGTYVHGHRCDRTGLSDGTTFRIGRTLVTFRAADLAADEVDRPRPQRPADPIEAMAGTVVGFNFVEPGDDAPGRDVSPVWPRPAPLEPACYDVDDVRGMLTAIASSSWDSIYETASRPLPPQLTIHPDALASHKRRKVRRPKSPVDLSLQVEIRQTTLQRFRDRLARAFAKVRGKDRWYARAA